LINAVKAILGRFAVALLGQKLAQTHLAVARRVLHIDHQKRGARRLQRELLTKRVDKARLAHGEIAFLEMFVHSKSYCAVRVTDINEVSRSHG
jgi:hypothetical protein